MPTVKIQDSDGREQFLIGPAVYGVAINSFGMFVSKIVCVKPEHLQILISSIVQNLKQVYPQEFEEAIKRLE